MDYLFFDIECCDGTHICSLGYVKTTDNFKILAKKDIIINPEKKFRLGSRTENKIKLSYPLNIFYNQGNFHNYYNQIRQLLTTHTLIGFSIVNDFNFINLACARYNLPQLMLKGIDIQQLHKYITNSQSVTSLQKVLEHYNISINTLHLHKSCDDAQLTMLVLKKMCKFFNFTLNDIIKKFPNCIIQSNIYKKKNIVTNLSANKKFVVC